MTMRRFDPILAICSSIRAFAPEPTAIMAMTAPTPMIIPSMVRAERILLTMRALRAMRRLARRRVIYSSYK
jgi:hypothetical protein